MEETRSECWSAAVNSALVARYILVDVFRSLMSITARTLRFMLCGALTMLLPRPGVQSRLSFAKLSWITLLPITQSAARTDPDADIVNGVNTTELIEVYNSTFMENFTLGWGFGFNLSAWDSCGPVYNEVLKNAAEIDKASSAVATMLMTLLPGLLSFGPLKTADIRTMFYFDFDPALFTAAMTLGFQLENQETANSRIYALSDICSLDKLMEVCGPPEAIPGGSGDPSPSDLNDAMALEHAASATLEQSARMAKIRDLYEHDFGKLKNIQRSVVGDPLSENTTETFMARHRRLTVIGVVIIFLFLQVCLCFALAGGAVQIDSTIFIWVCPEFQYYPFVWWLASSAVVSAILGGIIFSSLSNPDEVFHLSKLPTNVCHEDLPTVFEIGFPFPGRHKGWWNFKLRQVAGDIAEVFNLWNRAPQPTLSTILLRVPKIAWQRLMAQHPMVVVVRPRTEIRARWSPILVWMGGYLQLLYIGAASFFFGSIFLGSMFRTLGFVAVFITAVAVSRAISIFFCSWIENQASLYIIEYANDEEHDAIRILLNSMPGVLTESMTGYYKYAEGNLVAGPISQARKGVAQGRNFVFFCGVCSMLVGAMIAFVVALGVTVGGNYCLSHETGFSRGWPAGVLAFVFTWILCGNRIMNELKGAEGYSV